MAYKHAVPQLVFPKATKDELVNALHKYLPDYYDYEIKDLVENYGKAVQDLLLQGKQVHLPFIGTFTISTNGQKDYFNVFSKKWMHSYGSVTLKFKIGKQIRDRISSSIKQLLVQTLRLQADVPLENFKKPEKPSIN